jgi:hypothetical protein
MKKPAEAEGESRGCRKATVNEKKSDLTSEMCIQAHRAFHKNSINIHLLATPFPS